MISFELFYHLVCKDQFKPPNIIQYSQLEKIYFGHSSKKDSHPGLLPQQDFEQDFKHFKQLFVTLSGLDLLAVCESFVVESPFLYLAFFKTI